MFRMGIAAVLALVAGVSPSIVAAQGSVRGTITRDSSGAPVADAEVILPDLGRKAMSDSAGRFSLNDLPAGRHAVQVRKVGHALLRDTVSLGDGESATRDFALRRATVLDTVATVADGPRYRSPALRGFEERRQKKEGGYFIPADELRKSDDKGLANVVLSHVAGLRILQDRGRVYLASSRKTCSGPVFQGTRNCQPCYVTVYIDGQLTYQATEMNAGAEPVDFNRMGVNQLAGVEFYPATGTAPAGFNATGSGCGLLLLWTRER